MFLTKYLSVMKSIALVTAIVAGSLSQLAPAASQTDILRSRCAEQERQIKLLEKELDSMHALLAKNNLSPTKKSIAAATPSVGTSSYTIRQGDSLSKVARNNGISLNDLMAANSNINPNRLSIGQVIKLPVTNSSKPTPAVATAEPVQQLAPSTAKVLPDTIKPAQHAEVPKPTVSTTDYVIKKGDTLYGIARKKNTSIANILEQNQGLNPSRLRVGQSIAIATTNQSKTSSSVEKPATAVAKKSPVTPKKVATAPVAKKQEVAKTPAPQASASKSIAHVKKQAKVRTVSVTRQMTFGEFASVYGASVAQINEMNGLKLTKSTVLAQGSELYIPNNQH